jgi:hypothetical protein
MACHRTPRIAPSSPASILRHGGSPGLTALIRSLRGYHPDADRFTVPLRRGENHVLAFTTWVFYLSVGDF